MITEAETENRMERNLIKHGFVLILLALLTGFIIPVTEAPRLALSAHTIGLISGILLLTLSAVWKRLTLSDRQEKLAYWSWIYSSYANWFAILFGAVAGTGRMTPMASRGMEGASSAELFVAFLLISLSVAALLAVGLSIFGLSRAK